VTDKEETKVADEAKPKAAQEEEQPTYHVDRLIPEADERFGVGPHVAAGAFSLESKKNFTLDEAKELIRKYEKRTVESDNQIETGVPGEED
jgi:hypothetical protein